MKIGFIFECGPEGPDVQVCRHLVYKLDPTIEFFSSTLDNKKKLIEDCGAVAKVLLDECKKVIVKILKSRQHQKPQKKTNQNLQPGTWTPSTLCGLPACTFDCQRN